MKTTIRTTLKALFITLCLTTASTAAAVTVYATDKVRVPIRGGKGLNHKIIKMIPAGIPVKVLRKDKKSGYSYIQWAPKRRGWISNRLLMRKKPALLRLSKASKEIAALKKEILELQKQKQNPATNTTAASAATTTDAMPASANLVSNKATELAKQLETQNGALNRLATTMSDMADQNKALLKKLDLTYNELKQARDKTGAFQASDSRKWFIWGAFLAGLAFFTGIGVTRIRWQRGSIWH